ncbi:MAG TPA: hypothetical protein VHT96_09000 [Clostridia bacterium]|nr:hypothetical protein [Clostridia bacterium]
MKTIFPRTVVGGVSLPRLLIGANWITGFSHRTPAADHAIKTQNSTPEAVSSIFETFLEHDINAVMGLFSIDNNLYKAAELAQERTGKKMILIDEPILNMDDSPYARHEAELEIKKCAQRGSTFCLPLHSCVEELINKNKRTMDRLPDYLSMIRDAGMIPGLSAHMPEVIQYADENEYDVETYIQIFNCVGFLMQVEIESVIRIIHNAKKPVMAIKPCAAGRITPYVGLTFNWNVLRDQDMIAIGCMNPQEAAEDIEISLAAFQHRLPDLNSRSSPLLTSVISGKSNH